MPTLYSRENRIEYLLQQYDRGVQFHRQEFSEIEAKVKYWLTFLLPASLGLLGYLLKTDASALGVLLLCCVSCDASDLSDGAHHVCSIAPSSINTSWHP